MIKKRWLGLVMLGCAASAQASPFFTTFNQGAFARSFLLPSLSESQVLAADAARSQYALDQTNDYHFGRSGNETITIDGETARFSLRYARGFGDGFEWNAELPVLHQGGGFMDSFIERWHSWFGLPNGGREATPRNQYLYRVTRNGSTIFQRSESGTALGDARIGGGWQLRPGIALRAALQLPTGSKSKFTGGNAGLALWADAALPFEQQSAWRGFASLGATLAQRSEVLPDLQKREAVFGGFGLSYGWNEALNFTAQLYGHTALYKGTQLDALQRPGLQAAFGGSYAFSHNTELRLAVQEDPVTTSSPDFSVHIAVQVR